MTPGTARVPPDALLANPGSGNERFPVGEEGGVGGRAGDGVPTPRPPHPSMALMKPLCALTENTGRSTCSKFHT